MLDETVIAKIDLAIRADGEVTLNHAVALAVKSGLSEKDATKAVKSHMTTLVKRGIAKRRRTAGLATAWIHV